MGTTASKRRPFDVKRLSLGTESMGIVLPLRLGSPDIKRDVRATAKMHEVLGIWGFSSASGYWNKRFQCLAEKNYDGYLYATYFDVPLEVLLQVYAALWRIKFGDGQVVYNWAEELWNKKRLADAKCSENVTDVARIRFKRPIEANVADVAKNETDYALFGLKQKYDYQLDLLEQLSEQVAAARIGLKAFGTPARDFVILAIMDLIDIIYFAEDTKNLPLRISSWGLMRDPSGRGSGRRVGVLYLYGIRQLGLRANGGGFCAGNGVGLSAEEDS